MASITVNGSNSGQTISGDNNVITVEPGAFVVRVNGNTNNISGGTGPNTYVTQGTNNAITLGDGGGTFTALGNRTQVTASQGDATGTIQGDDAAFTGGDNRVQLRVIGDRATLSLSPTNTNANTLLLQGDGIVFAGGAGADTIAAVGNDDFLSGAGGADTFAFTAGNSALSPSDFNVNVPTVQDFDAGAGGDRVAVLIAPNAVYGSSLSALGLTPQSTLDPTRFQVGVGPTSPNTRFVYDPGTGALLFTPFGNARPETDHVATLGRNLPLTAGDIYISNPSDTLSAGQSPLAGLPGGDPFAAPPAAAGFTISSSQTGGIAEGNYGTTPYAFTVERTDATSAVTLSYTVTGAGANPALARQFLGGSLPTGTVTFAPGETSKTVAIPVQGNTEQEGDTAFQVALTDAAGTGVGAVNIAALGFIRDDDNYQHFPGSLNADAFTDRPYSAPYNGNLYGGNGGRDTFSIGATARGATTAAAPNGDVVLVHQGHTDVLRGVAEARFVDGRLVFDANDVAAQVVRMYQAGLGRDPDQEGLNFWIGRLQQGANLGQIAQGFLATPEGLARFGSNPSDTEFVNRIYVNVLGRDPEQGGLAFWVGRLQEGAPRQDVLAGIAESPENKTRTAPSVTGGIWDLDEEAAQVARMYDTALGRLPDVGGLDFWTRGINENRLTLQNMADQFVNSTEFQATYGSLSNRDFVRTIYQNTLDRPGDQGGIDYWTSRLDQDATRAQVVTGFSESAEHQLLTAPNIRSDIPGQYGILTA